MKRIQYEIHTTPFNRLLLVRNGLFVVCSTPNTPVQRERLQQMQHTLEKKISTRAL